MAAKKGGLGRGLDSLFGENSSDTKTGVTLRLSEIEPNRDQPRKDFDEEALGELAASIEKHGLLQPIAVRPTATGTYQIIAGERRWRACRMAGLETVPVVIKEADDREYTELALIENLQREDLNPVEEALGYRTLTEKYGLTQEQVAESVGKSRSAVANMLRLLLLKDAELEALRSGKITAGHARALLALEGDKRKEAFAAALSGASVRDIENAAKKNTAAKKQPRTAKCEPFFKEVQIAMEEQLGRKVNIKPTSGEKGTITLEFYSKEELSEIAKKLC